MQLDQEDKGFSFSKEGPLDMRMDPTQPLTAKEIVNHWSEKDLKEIFQEYGEDPRAEKAAKAVVEARRKSSIETTKQLADILSSALKTKTRGRLHPATLVFQALRICVNQELEAIKKGLSKAISLLSSEGKIGVMSFHSLEDRIVKNVFRMAATPRKEGKERWAPILQLLTKKPLVPSWAEIRLNPRARSAKLRFAQKI